MLECLNPLIGYVPATCSCLDSVPNNFGENPTSSTLSKYLADLIPDDFEKNCGDASVWNTFKRAREGAKVDMIKDLIDYYTLNGTIRNAWTGYAGKDTGGTLVNSKTWAGMRLSLIRNARGMNATVKEVMVKTSTVGTYTLKIINRYGEELHTQSIDIGSPEVQKWKKIALSASVKLPLWTDDSVEAQYYILWDAVNVYANESDCFGCASTPPFYATYFNPQGIAVNELTALPEQATNNFFAGIRPRITIECAFDELICAADGQVLTSAAICMQYRWAINLIEATINSGEITKLTSMGIEYLQGLLELHKPRYEHNIAYLAQILYTADCVQCNPSIKRQSIRL